MHKKYLGRKQAEDSNVVGIAATGIKTFNLFLI